MDSEKDTTLTASAKPKGHLVQPLPGWFAATGWSMFPTLRSGDVVRIAKPRDGYHVGHVVAFYLKERLMIHRIVGEDAEKCVWRVKGDACVHFDPWLAKADIVGCILMARRGGRIITIAPDRTKSKISMMLGAFAGQYLGFLPRRWARLLYLPCFLAANAILKCVRLSRWFHERV